MYVRKDKPQENKSQSTAKLAGQNKTGGINSFEFVDNRTQLAQLKWQAGRVSDYSSLQLDTTEDNNNAVTYEDSAIQRVQNVNEPVSHGKNHEVVQRIYNEKIEKGKEGDFFTFIKLIAEGAAGAVYSAKLTPSFHEKLREREQDGEEDAEGLPMTADELIAVKHVNGNALEEEKIDSEENVPLEATLPGILTKQHRKRVGNNFAKISPDTFGVLVVNHPKQKGEMKEFFIMMELAKGSVSSVTPDRKLKLDDFNVDAKAYFNNLNAALITLGESGYTSGDIKGDNTLVVPTVDDGKGVIRTGTGTGDDEESVSAVLADFGDYKKGAYISRVQDLTNIMNNMFAITEVKKDFDQITKWSTGDKFWQDKSTEEN